MIPFPFKYTNRKLPSATYYPINGNAAYVNVQQKFYIDTADVRYDPEAHGESFTSAMHRQQKISNTSDGGLIGADLKKSATYLIPV